MDFLEKFTGKPARFGERRGGDGRIAKHILFISGAEIQMSTVRDKGKKVFCGRKAVFDTGMAGKRDMRREGAGIKGQRRCFKAADEDVMHR